MLFFASFGPFDNDFLSRNKNYAMQKRVAYKCPYHSSAQQWGGVQIIDNNNNNNNIGAKERIKHRANIEGEKEDHCQPDGCLPLS